MNHNIPFITMTGRLQRVEGELAGARSAEEESRSRAEVKKLIIMIFQLFVHISYQGPDLT